MAHSQGYLAAGCWQEAQVSYHEDLSIGLECLHDMAADILQSK